jgi:hypothetical protein
MQTTDWRNDVNRFDRALRVLRREAPAAGLENARALFIDRRVTNRLPRVLAFGLAAGVVAMAPLVLRTPAAATMSMAEVRAAAEAAPRVHSRWYTVQGGKDMEMHMEQWQDGSRFRHDIFGPKPQGTIQYAFDGARGWYRVPAKRYVMISSKPKFEGTFTPSLWKMLDGDDGKKVPAREVLVDGKPMREITFKSLIRVRDRDRYFHTYRTVWTVDPKAKRPSTVRNYRLEGKEWELISRATFEYPETLEPSLFALSPRDGETVFDKDEEARALPGLWAKGLGSQKVGGQTITLRDVVLDRNGVAGVIWTGGGRFAKAPTVTIADRADKKWTGQPYLAYTRSRLNLVPESRLTKIDGKPNRMVMLHGLHGVVTAPFRIEIPVASPDGKPVGTATFRLSKFRDTDQLYDLADRMGISNVGSAPARAIQR